MTAKELEFFNQAFDAVTKKNKAKSKFCWTCFVAVTVLAMLARLYFNF